MSGPKIDRFINTKALKPLFYNDLGSAHYEPIICYQKGKKIVGYEAIFLPEFCDLILQAKDLDLLNTDAQKRVADRCGVLVRSLAKVGIIALIDEATGYQYDRENNALQKILEKYISEELLPWKKRFPDEFYREIFRLNNWYYTVPEINKTARPWSYWKLDEKIHLFGIT